MRVFGILKDSLVNGPGIRLVIFMQGCNLHCKGCHNPASWDPRGGYVLSIDELDQYITPITSGVTISGGEPTMQLDAVKDILDWARERGLNTMIYTGLTDAQFYDKIRFDAEIRMNLDYIKTGPYVEELRSLDHQYGSTNQRSSTFENFIRRSGRCRENDPVTCSCREVRPDPTNWDYTQSAQGAAGD